jgi:hypothetical protein
MRGSVLLGLALAQTCAAQNGVSGTVDPGDNYVAPDLALDENFFYCRIEPDVIQKFSCASGQSGEAGQCHDSRSALRLRATDGRSACDGAGRVSGAIPDAFTDDLEAVRYFVQGDPLTSPFYLRPINRVSHPRRIFDESDPAAQLIEQWIAAGAR